MQGFLCQQSLTVEDNFLMQGWPYFCLHLDYYILVCDLITLAVTATFSGKMNYRQKLDNKGILVVKDQYIFLMILLKLDAQDPNRNWSYSPVPLD